MRAFAYAALALGILGIAVSAQTTCPIKPETQDLDFSALSAACRFRFAAVVQLCTQQLLHPYPWSGMHGEFFLTSSSTSFAQALTPAASAALAHVPWLMSIALPWLLVASPSTPRTPHHFPWRP